MVMNQVSSYYKQNEVLDKIFKLKKKTWLNTKKDGKSSRLHQGSSTQP